MRLDQVLPPHQLKASLKMPIPPALRRIPRDPLASLMALPRRACPCAAAAAELPQPAKSGIALGCQEPIEGRFDALRRPFPPGHRTPKSPAIARLRALPPQVLPKKEASTTSSGWVRSTLLELA